MKKVTSLLLALVMALALAVPAFAEDLDTTTEVNGNVSQNVEANVSITKDQTISKYYVTVTWTTPSFSYSFGGTEYTWDTDGLKYNTKALGTNGWGTNGDASQTENFKLEVTNKSDNAVYCKTELKKSDAHPDLTVTYGTEGVTTGKVDAVVDSTNPSNYTDNTDGKITEKSYALDTTITMGGHPAKNAGKNVLLATITLTLSKTDFE